jgi:hypothetical protein
MDPSDLLSEAAKIFESLEIDYFVTGSMATISYGEPRFTNDVDIVARIEKKHVDQLFKAFPPPEYYCSKEAVLEAIESKRMFNIIHPSSGLKLDIMIPSDVPFDQSRFERCRQIMIGDHSTVAFASPEDVILKKLTYYQQGGSEKHLRDIRGVLKLQKGKIDFEYLKSWATELDVLHEYEQVLES